MLLASLSSHYFRNPNQALMGNRGERTTTRWQSVAAAAGLEVEAFVETPSPSIGLVVLRSGE